MNFSYNNVLLISKSFFMSLKTEKDMECVSKAFYYCTFINPQWLLNSKVNKIKQVFKFKLHIVKL